MYDLAENDDFDREMIATYEEVSKLYPRGPGSNRPVVRFLSTNYDRKLKSFFRFSSEHLE